MEYSATATTDRLSPERVRRSRIERVLAQLAQDERLYSTELIEVLAHAAGVRSSADYRILQAASLLHEERELDHHRRVAAELGDGPTDVAQMRADALTAEHTGQSPHARFGPDGLEQAVAEVGAVLNVPAVRARALIAAGSVMRYDLPETGRTLAAGRIDLPRFLLIVQRTEFVDADHMSELDSALSDEISRRAPMSLSRFRIMVDSIVSRIDPEAVRRRTATVDADRHITIRPDNRAFGQSHVSGTLPSDQAATIDSRLDAMTAAVHYADGRTRRQLRADALLALARGEQCLPCRCDDCTAEPVSDDAATTPAGAESAPDVAPQPCTCHRARPTFHIVVGMGTLLQFDENPAVIDGHGLIDADTARALVTEAQRSYIHAATHQSADSAQRYAIPDRLRALVTSGELCCTFPGCNNPVHTTDLDHTVPFDHTSPARGGPTARHNLKPLCRVHHRAKTFNIGWRDYQTPLDEVFFQSPTGHVFAGNAFTARDLFPDLRIDDKPPDHPARAHLTQRRRSRHDSALRAQQRADERWDADHPIPF